MFKRFLRSSDDDFHVVIETSRCHTGEMLERFDMFVPPFEPPFVLGTYLSPTVLAALFRVDRFFRGTNLRALCRDFSNHEKHQVHEKRKSQFDDDRSSCLGDLIAWVGFQVICSRNAGT